MSLPESLRQDLQDIIFSSGEKPNQWRRTREVCNKSEPRSYLFDLIYQFGYDAAMELKRAETIVTPRESSETYRFNFQNIDFSAGWIMRSLQGIGSNSFVILPERSIIALLIQQSARGGEDCSLSVAALNHLMKYVNEFKHTFVVGIRGDAARTVLGSLTAKDCNDKFKDKLPMNGKHGPYHWVKLSDFDDGEWNLDIVERKMA